MINIFIIIYICVIYFSIIIFILDIISIILHRADIICTDDFLIAAISAFRLKMSMAPWQYREYCLPYDMDESNTRVSFWLWVDDAAWFNQQIWEFEIASTGVNNENNWIWQHNSTNSNLVNGWNKITEDLSNASGGGKRNPRVINYARFVMQTANPTGRHTYKIDDIRFEKK